MSQEERDRILLNLVKQFDEAKRDWLLQGSDLDEVAKAYRKVSEHIEDVIGHAYRKGLSTVPLEQKDVRPYPDIVKMLGQYRQSEDRAFDISRKLSELGHDVLFPPVG